MPDKFDPYREALVIETKTVWPDDIELDPADKQRLEESLHGDPATASHLEYMRLHTGFCRIITVTSDDLERLGT